MPIKSRRYRKINKSSRTRKNKITRRYKKQMKGGNDGLIKDEDQLELSWQNDSVKWWEVDDGQGDRRLIYREDSATVGKMPYGTKDDNVNMSTFRGKINYYLKKVVDKQKDAYIKEIYH